MKDIGFKEKIGQAKLVAVLVIGDASKAVPVAKALYEGGIRALEITFRTDCAADCIRLIKSELQQDMLVGAGTLLTPSQVLQAKAAGAHFGVAPGANAAVIKAAKAEGLDFAPGVFTPSDIELALENGCSLMKYFPAASLGMEHLRSMSAPYKHLGVKFIPLGGVSQSNLREFLADGLIAAVGGSWLAKPEEIDGLQLGKIREKVGLAYSVLKEFK